MRFPSIGLRLARSPNTITKKTKTQSLSSFSLHHSEPNSRAAEQSCLALLQACNSLFKLTQTHAHLIKSGLQNNPLVLTKLSDTCSSLNTIDYAAQILFSPHADTHLYDTFLFNTIIRGYAQTHHAKLRAISSFALMLRYSILPNKFTFPFVLKACAGLLDLCLGAGIHGFVLKFGFETDPYVQNTLIHMYSCCGGGGIKFARKVFDEMPQRNPVSWSAMIGGYVRCGRSNDAIVLFREMQIGDVQPDEITMVTVLSACADLGALEIGKWIGFYIEKEGITRTVPLCNALIDMFAKCGDIDSALRVFEEMRERSIVTWTSVIDGLAMHGRGVEAVAFFEEMKNAGVAPDDVAFIGVLSACSHAGMVEEGCQYFNLMRIEFGILPKIEHYGCMVDLFSRAGLLKNAIEFVQEMPIEPNPIIWRILIGACRVHGELDLGESITKRLLGTDPMQGSNYVLLSNIYAMKNRWEKKYKIREMMGKKGLQKVPGCSLVELNGKIYEFVAGDKSHSQYKEIFEMVEEMGRELKRAGYVPMISDVLLDIDEEDKEDALYRHSEKLAIAFVLLNTRPGEPIRIVKNLRVCGDCHSAFKFISKVYVREIVVRDRNRFHLFKNGACSCKEFW